MMNLKLNLKKSLLILLAINVIYSCSQSGNLELLNNGEITLKELFELKKDWELDYLKYKPQIKILSIDSNISFKIFLATWCHDSEREIPRFLKIFSELKLKENKLQMYLIDRTKKKPEKEINENKIFFTPTFIVYYKNIEITRIIEEPEKDWPNEFESINKMIQDEEQ